jgi:hypothetical protein
VRDGQPLQYLERRHRADHRSLNHPRGPDRPSSQPRTEMISTARQTEQVDNARWGQLGGAVRRCPVGQSPRRRGGQSPGLRGHRGRISTAQNTC